MLLHLRAGELDARITAVLLLLLEVSEKEESEDHVAEMEHIAHILEPDNGRVQGGKGVVLLHEGDAIGNEEDVIDGDSD
jgi:hypothetical protein